MNGARVRDVTRYNATCLIGNWSEDRELQRTMMRDMLVKKGTGTLRLDAYRTRMQATLMDVELTKVADDPYLHFGDVVQLVHVDTGCVVAGDPHEKVGGPGEESCLATAAPNVRAPCARNSLILVKYVPPKNASVLEPDYPDDMVHYGQKVRLALYPEAIGAPVDRAGGPRPLSLFSKPVSTTHCSKYSRNQLVGFTHQGSFDSVWQVVTPDPAMRGMSEGVEVALGAPILLVHCATQKPLCLESQKVPNDYGIELELSAHSAMGNGMKLAMEQMFQGIAKGFLPKGELSDNYFTFVGGSKVEQLPEPSTSTSGTEPLQELLGELRGKQGAISLLERKLVTLEDAACLLSHDEFALVLRQVGSTLSEGGIAALVAHFTPGKTGFIDCNAFRKAVRAATATSTGSW